MVLAGGLGQRIRPVIGDNQKCLAPVGGVPFLEILINLWLSQGVTRFSFLLGFKSDDVVLLVRTIQAKFGFEVDFIVEPFKMGTGGALLFGIQELKISDQFYAANADTFVAKGLSILSESEDTNVIGLRSILTADRFGRVTVDSEMRVVKFEEKPIFNREAGEVLVNTGNYKFEPSFFDGLAVPDQELSLERDVIPRLLQKNVLKGIVVPGAFVDIGVEKDYFSAEDIIFKEGL